MDVLTTWSVCVLWLLPGVIYAQNLGNACVSPSGQRGACTTIRECPFLLDMLVQSRRTRDFQYLKQSHCGFEGQLPVLCCPGRTPRGMVTQTTVAPKPLISSTARPGPEKMVQQPNGALLPTECGDQTTDNIVGGVKAMLGAHPWLAGLEYLTHKGRFVLCGGALISNRYVLTAAHCIRSNDDARLVAVRLGDHDTSKDVDCEESGTGGHCADPARTVTIERTIRHPRYSTGSDRHNDIALIRLGETINFTDFIRPICLPTGDMLRDKLVGRKQTVAGWGRTETSWRSLTKLQVALPTIANDDCQRAYESRGVKLDASQMCAGGESGKDSCSGDSGGPLMNFNMRWYVTGVVSIGPEICGTEGQPGVYSRVSSFMDWILENVKP